MRELPFSDDIWRFPSDAIVVPVNQMLRNNGNAIMGAGLAKQALGIWPELEERYGKWLRENKGNLENSLYMADIRTEEHELCLIFFPTKRDWRGKSDIDLIHNYLSFLMQMAEHYGWGTVSLPRLGCGLGGLDWTIVKALLERHLDNRFVVVNR